MDNSCKLFVENITPEQLQELDNSISNEGEFRMKNKDEHIKEIYEKDKNVLEQNHITYEHIGHLMEIFNDITNLNQIFDNGKLMEFYINYVFNNTLIPEILKKYNIYAYLAGLQSVFEYENYYVVPVRYLGACVCPFQKLTSNKNYNGCEYGNSDIVVINKLTKKCIQFGSLLGHMILCHHFFEGSSEYRIDPKKWIDFFEIKPETTYIRSTKKPDNSENNCFGYWRTQILFSGMSTFSYSN